MSHTVLLADDDFQLRTVLALYLRSCGWQVLEASTGTEALKVFRKAQHKPELVVLDIRMHNDGLSTCRTFKTDTYIVPHRPKIVILSAADRDKYGPLATRVGADLLLSKPIKAEHLHLALEQMLAGEADLVEREMQRRKRHSQAQQLRLSRSVSMAMMFQLPGQVGYQAVAAQTQRLLRDEYGHKCAIKPISSSRWLLLYLEVEGQSDRINQRAQRVLGRLNALAAGTKNPNQPQTARYSGISFEAMARLTGKPSLSHIAKHLGELVEMGANNDQAGSITMIERFSSRRPPAPIAGSLSHSA